ncbi:RWP-RK domain [Dillenia turbinata]|uniref:RWP-RK domain n=1 Tax=Dillenia turbinata TaxID=194707 RepID=A0AAN8YU91_9MAGN
MEESSNFDDNIDISFLDLPSFPSSSSNPPQSSEGIAEADDPSNDPIFWRLKNDLGVDPNGSDNKTDGVPPQKGIHELLPLPSSFHCSLCNVLRQITHTNGTCVMKLEIHGKLGMFSHAILASHDVVDGKPTNFDYQEFKFGNRRPAIVKQFMMQYCLKRKHAGFIMLEDPLSVFYDALRVGLSNRNKCWIPPPQRQSQPIQPQPQQPPYADEDESQVKQPRTRPSLKEQRQRTAKLTMSDLAPHFHITMEKAAEEMSLCTTVIKKLCRRQGVSRWPHRKIKSLKKQILNFEKLLKSQNVEERRHAETQIQLLHQSLQQEVDRLVAGKPLEIDA